MKDAEIKSSMAVVLERRKRFGGYLYDPFPQEKTEMKFEVYTTRNKQWRWRLRADNGRLVANAGESFKRKVDCLDSVKLVISSSVSAGVNVQERKRGKR